jgi:uncharacterized protein (DUF2141 family)
MLYLSTISHTYAATVIVKVNNIEKKGEIHLAVYDDAEVFKMMMVKKVAQQKVSFKV